MDFSVHLDFLRHWSPFWRTPETLSAVVCLCMYNRIDSIRSSDLRKNGGTPSDPDCSFLFPRSSRTRVENFSLAMDGPSELHNGVCDCFHRGLLVGSLGNARGGIGERHC